MSVDRSTARADAPSVTPPDFFAYLDQLRVGPCVGVPCSLIASLAAYASAHSAEVEWLNPAHEAHAMAIAAGEYMGSRGTRLPLVFLQNSGLGHILNPLLSLHRVYEIPALLLVTWRGERGSDRNAPEHRFAGREMETHLRAFRLPSRTMSARSWREDIATMREEALRTRVPTVLCARRGLFADDGVPTIARSRTSISLAPRSAPGPVDEMTTREAIALVKKAIPDGAYLSTAGFISQESFAARDTPDFYMLGSMGLASGIAAGCARHTRKRLVVLDGDGALMMHLGLLAYLGQRAPANLLHIVLDNEAYASTGGQPSCSRTVDFAAVARACGYPIARRAESREALGDAIAEVAHADGPALIHVKVRRTTHRPVSRVSERYSGPAIRRRFVGHL